VAHHLPTGKQGRIRWTYEGEEGNDEAERLIQIVPNRGPIIPIIPWEEAQQIYDVRSLIEGEAAALAAGAISDDEIFQG